jgi:hypothetical protein
MLDYFKDKSVCVVANTLIEEDLNVLVDSHDIVIRFNNPYLYNKGSKVNVIASSLFKNISFPTLFSYQNVDYYLATVLDVSQPSNCYYSPRNIKESLNLGLMTQQQFDKFKYPLTNDEILEIEKNLMFTPSSGIYILYWLIKKIDFKSLSVVGFSFIGRTWTHSFEKEGLYVKSLLDASDKKVEFYPK